MMEKKKPLSHDNYANWCFSTMKTEYNFFRTRWNIEASASLAHTAEQKEKESVTLNAYHKFHRAISQQNQNHDKTSEKSTFAQRRKTRDSIRTARLEIEKKHRKIEIYYYFA